MVAAAPSAAAGAAPRSPSVQGELLRGSTILGAATVVNSALSVLYTFVAARLLSPGQYGELVALLSIVGLFGAPASTVQLVLAHHVASTGYAAGRLIRALGVANLVLAAACLLGAPALAGYLRLTDAAPAAWLALASLGVLLLPALRGVVQGLCHFGRLAALTTGDVLVKVIGGLTLVALGYGSGGAVAAVAAAACAGAALTALALRSAPRAGAMWGGAPADSPAEAPLGQMRALLRFSGPALALNGGLLALTMLDTIVARHYLPPAEAGAYAAVAVVGRSLFWISTAVAAVVLPLAARHRDSAASLLRPALALTAGVALVGLAIFHAAPALILTLLFGPDYAMAAPLLPLYGWAALLLALSNVAVNYQLGRGSGRAAVAAAVAPLVFIALVIPFHADGRQIVQAYIGAGASFLVLLLPFVPRRERAGGE